MPMHNRAQGLTTVTRQGQVHVFFLAERLQAYRADQGLFTVQLTYPSLLEGLTHLLHWLATLVAQLQGCHPSMLCYGACP